MKRHCLWILVSIFILSLFSTGLNAQEAIDQAADDASIFIVHGVPGLDIGEEATYPVDIYIKGTKRLSAVKYGQIKPIKITSGTSTIAVYKVGMGPEAGYSPVLSENFNFKKSENASVVGYIHPDGEVRFAKFTNDFSPAGDPSKCRISVHNTSAEAKMSVWIYNDNQQQDWDPDMGTEVIDPGDKFDFEIAKKSLVDNQTWDWWLEIGAGWYWEKWRLVYDKPFQITAGKGMLLYLIGSSTSKTFKLIKKLVPLK